jgi:hypothetical protein
MSIKTFFEKVGQEIKKLFGSSTFEQEVQSTITYAAPLVEGILAIADPEIEPIVAGVLNTVKSDLATVSTVVQSAKVAPGSSAAKTISAALTSINSNLSGLLKVAEVKNSTKIAEITAAVNTLTGETNALLSNLPA